MYDKNKRANFERVEHFEHIRYHIHINGDPSYEAFEKEKTADPTNE